jgi:hypothetical protein
MKFFVGVYWSSRRESREQCAMKIAEFLIALRSMHPVFGQWHVPVRSRKKKETARELPWDASSIANLLTQNQKDIGKEVIPELGFGYAGWNEVDQHLSANFTMYSGSYSNHVGNSVVVEITDRSAFPVTILGDVLRKAVQVFDPDEGTVEAGDPSKPVHTYSRKMGLYSSDNA